ncbi:Membrane protein involved in the export of O-antigen and teichoic acid [Actinokineospora alba]|uniref:Membrane protein involved in the export of O-antigen and teichoic acid n=2 Tax=Actinokineospora alba TaxID=504798 RepID=A0A1H0TAZ4_9PSEU|nr:O-antigen/teichoic acid export membrane protein [Actinokineospora alba]SDJ20519.1 Membrane protein involved in the export of O-antigen and teichoic acid [Actinokineospora alba]SDP51212.1 Membrane protein involved in the export of O-antigen and teichoic acid [Actinokineospora alba]
MGAGVVVVGIAGYVFIALAGHAFSTADAAALVSFYLIVSIIGPGVFVGLEQETSRSTSAWLAGGRSFRIVARNAVVVGGGLLAVVTVVLAAIGPLLTDEALSGQWGLFVAILITVAASTVMYLVRGLLGGMQRFGGYAATLVVEGITRLLLCVAIVVAGNPDATFYAISIGLGTVLAVVAGLPWLRKPHAGAVTDLAEISDGAGVRAMTRRLVLMVAAAFGFHLVGNLAPIVVTAKLGAADTPTAAAFASAFVLVRVPVLLFAVVQAMLLPALTKAATIGDFVTVRSTLGKFLAAVAAIGVPTVALAFLVGPQTVELFFGAQVRLPNGVVGLLAIGTVLILITQVLMPALLALGKNRIVTVAWALGAVVLVGSLSLPFSPMEAGAWAHLAGCGTAALTMAASLVNAVRVRADSWPDRR